MLFSRSELRMLTEKAGQPVVSIYMPTHRVGDIQQDAIRLKNILRAAGERMVNQGIRTTEAKRVLKPASRLLDDIDFWQHQSDGLALFVSPEMFRYYRLPYDFQELLMTGDSCYVKPLLPLLHADGMFYVLALSQNAVRLVQCTRYSERIVTPDNTPGSIAEALKHDEPEKQQQLHTTGAGPAIFHGQGVSKDYDKVSILRYFKQVDRSLHSLLRDEKAPLVLAAVDYLHSIYREASTYTHRLEHGITGNPDNLSESQLRQQAWAVVEPLFTYEQEKAISEYQVAVGKGMNVNDVKKAVLAAHDGRISILFVAAEVQQWGSFDEEVRKVRLYNEARPGAEDLLERACIDTLLKGGDIFALPIENIPGSKPVAGILRY